MRLATFREQKLPNYSFRLIAAALREWGYDLNAALTAAELPAASVEEPCAEVTGSQELAFQRVFCQLTWDEPRRWLELGMRYRVLSHAPDCYGLLMQTSPTVDLAIRAGLQMSELTFSLAEAFGIYDGGRLVGIRSMLSEVPSDLRRFTMLRDVGSMVSVFNDLWHEPFPFDRIETPLPAGDIQHLQAYLPEVEIRGGSDCIASYWSVALDERRPPLSDPILHDVYRRRCAVAVESVRHGNDIVVRLVDLVSNAKGHLGLADAARRLALSARTLQRRLELQGMTYREVVRLGRYRTACRMLAQTRTPIGLIAFDVGYESLSSFNHAFRQQAGMTPSRYRRNVVTARTLAS